MKLKKKKQFKYRWHRGVVSSGFFKVKDCKINQADVTQLHIELFLLS